MEGFKEYQLNPLTVDFKKAFDSINRTVLFSIQHHWSIPKIIVNAIQALNSNSSCAVMVDRGIFEPVNVT